MYQTNLDKIDNGRFNNNSTLIEQVYWLNKKSYVCMTVALGVGLKLE